MMDVPYWAIHEDIERVCKEQYRPEASIIERYIAEEAIKFCTDYLSQVEAIGVPKSRYHGRGVGKGTWSAKVITLSRDEVLQAHLYMYHT